MRAADQPVKTSADVEGFGTAVNVSTTSLPLRMLPNIASGRTSASDCSNASVPIDPSMKSPRLDADPVTLRKSDTGHT